MPIDIARLVAAVPEQSAANARWWALRWYKKASPAEREAMRQLLDECGTGATQATLPLA